MSGDRDKDGRADVTTPHGSAADAGAGTVRGFTLEVVGGEQAGDCYESSDDHATIGSHRSSDLVLADSTVSSFHCEIAIELAGARIRDLGSRSGTILDGTRINDAFLKAGSTLRLGRSVVRFRFAGRSVRLPLSDRERFGELVGSSVAIRSVYAVLERAATTQVTVLLEGETGTGKRAAARTIHAESERRSGPFVMIDCGAVPANLLESELFGHERGSFTGASAARVGAFEEADGGTVFLDEIGELPAELQPKLLGALENRTIRRVGSDQARAVDVRVIAATKRDLRAEVNAGRFREDLYFRLAVVKLGLPPLRHRLEDLPELARRLLVGLSAPSDKVEELSSDPFLRQLTAAAWPGNVRELRTYLEQCLVFDDALAPGVEGDVGELEASEPIPVDVSLPLSEARRQALDAFERVYITELLRAHGGKVSLAAATAGVDRTYLYQLLRRHRPGATR